jgi:hypothetical protein
MFCIAQVIIEPTFESLFFNLLHPHINKVEIGKDTTKIFCSINYQESWKYSLPKSMYLEDLKSGKKYQITKCVGLPFEPEECILNSGVHQFVFYFPCIKNLDCFNLVEMPGKPSKGGLFNIYGINLNTTFQKQYNENDYKRFQNMSDFYKSANDSSKHLDFEKKELEAIIAFLEGNSFEEVIRLAVSIGGDSDTIGCMAGAIAACRYPIPSIIAERCDSILTEDLRDIKNRFVNMIEERENE